MSFTGDLDHLSIVDVVQLLHATRKSGTLTVRGQKGECQLVFNDGFIISANHFDNSIRIGKILVEAGVIGQGVLLEALAAQEAAGKRRRPLVATLLESGKVKRDEAYRGLETLIELTIVEVLGWKAGTFTLEVGVVTPADEYRYFPEKLNQELRFHTENVLMEALRIFDEKKRDASPLGAAGEREWAPEEDIPFIEEVPPGEAGESAHAAISADELGLGNVERLERRIPQVLEPLVDRPPVAPSLGAIREAAPELPPPAQEAIAAHLDGLPPRSQAGGDPPVLVVLLSADPLLAHCLTAVCRHEGLLLFHTTEARDIEPIVAKHLGKGGFPLLVADGAGTAGAGGTAALLAEARRRHPRLRALELAPAGRCELGSAPGVRTVLTLPARTPGSEAFAAEYLRFLDAFPALARGHVREGGEWLAVALSHAAAALRESRDAAGVARALLRAVATLCGRSLTLVVRGGELVAASGIGLRGTGGEPETVPGVAIPLAKAPLLQQAVASARCHVGALGDAAVQETLYGAIGAPREAAAVLVPLIGGGRTVSLTYGDAGAQAAAAPPREALELLAGQAGLALELVLCRRKLEHPPR